MVRNRVVGVVLGELLPDATPQKRGLMSSNSFFLDKHLEEGEYNVLLKPGVYSHGYIGNGVPTGTLSVFRGQRYIAHVDIGVDANIRVRTIRANGEILTDWKILSATNI